MLLYTIWQKYLHLWPNERIYSIPDKTFHWVMIEAVDELWSRPGSYIYHLNVLPYISDKTVRLVLYIICLHVYM